MPIQFAADVRRIAFQSDYLYIFKIDANPAAIIAISEMIAAHIYIHDYVRVNYIAYISDSIRYNFQSSDRSLIEFANHFDINNEQHINAGSKRCSMKFVIS